MKQNLPSEITYFALIFLFVNIVISLKGALNTDVDLFEDKKYLFALSLRTN